HAGASVCEAFDGQVGADRDLVDHLRRGRPRENLLRDPEGLGTARPEQVLDAVEELVAARLRDVEERHARPFDAAGAGCERLGLCNALVVRAYVLHRTSFVTRSLSIPS